MAAATIKRDIGKDILKLVDLMHEEKKISREVIFAGIEAAIKLAAERHFKIEEGAEGVAVNIDRSPATSRRKGRRGCRSGHARPHRGAVGKASHDPEDPRGGIGYGLRRVQRQER